MTDVRLALVACAALGCGVPAGVLTPETAARLDVHRVEWNPRHERIDAVTGVEDLGSDVVVFSRSSTTVIADGVVNVEPRVLRAGAIVPAPDGSGSWITSLDDHGRVWRLRARRTFEPVSDRYGLEGKAVHALTGFGGRYVAFAIGENDLAVADGASITHFAAPHGVESMIAGTTEQQGVRVWLTRSGDLLTVDPRGHTSQSYELEEPLLASANGRVFVASKRAIYEEKPGGELLLRYVAQGDVRGLAASNDHVWFTEAGELGVLDEAGVSRTHGANLAPGARLVGSQSGDVWSIDSRGALVRWAIGNAAAQSRGAWSDVVAPVFARACAGCHAPDGTAGVDLSKEGAWRTKRDLLRQRVVTDHDMPPQGHALSDSDRATLRAWIDARDGT